MSRKNPGDDELRELERLASRGDAEARRKLLWKQAQRMNIYAAPVEASARFLYSGMGDGFGGWGTDSGISIVLYAFLSPGATWADVAEEWLRDFNDRGYDECYGWQEEHPHHVALEIEAPLMRLTDEQVMGAIIGMLRQDLQSVPLNEIPFEGAPTWAEMADPECEQCQGMGLYPVENCEMCQGTGIDEEDDTCDCHDNRDDVCKCAEDSESPVAIILLTAECEEEEDE